MSGSVGALETRTRTSVANPGELDSIDETAFATGEWAYVVSLDAYFTLKKDSVLAADNINVINTRNSDGGVEPGRWIRFFGATGGTGGTGSIGATGITGPTGATGGIPSAQYAQIGDMVELAATQPLTFATAVLTHPDIIAATGVFPPFATGTIFELVNIGRYEVNYQATFPTDGGLVLYQGPTRDAAMLPQPHSMIGKSPNGQIAGSVIVETTTLNSFISLNSAAGNAAPVDIPANSSTTNANATTISFKQIS